MSDDPFLSRLMRFRSGLRIGGAASTHEVLATYYTRIGEAPFAFCRDGLLLEPTGAARFIPFIEIEDAGYYNREMVERAKRMRMRGKLAPLSIRLANDEVIDLQLDVRDDGMPDLLTIASLIEQRVRIAKAEQGREPSA